jgi:hypothetical protein
MGRGDHSSEWGQSMVEAMQKPLHGLSIVLGSEVEGAFLLRPLWGMEKNRHEPCSSGGVGGQKSQVDSGRAQSSPGFSGVWCCPVQGTDRKAEGLVCTQRYSRNNDWQDQPRSLALVLPCRPQDSNKLGSSSISLSQHGRRPGPTDPA